MAQISVILIGFSISLSILAGAMVKLTTLNWDNVFIGLTTLTVLMAGLTTVALVLSKNTVRLTAIGLGIIGISTSISILAKAVEVFGKMKRTELEQGGVALIGIMTALVLFVKATNELDFLKTALGIAIVTGAITGLSLAVAIFGRMQIPTLVQGFATIAVALGMFVGALKLMPQFAVLGSAGAIFILATAMTALSLALGILGNKDELSLNK
jgi:hypothetical protein